jgi:signal transduction histidine kinase
MQVLLNLLKNAAEAILEEEGEAQEKDKKSLGERQIRLELSEERDKIHLDVYNSGRPIPEEVLPNIFVPFFTTKDSGTGIGLSVSRYIMRLHGGTLTHFTKGEWTVFRMTFYHSTQ